jgi:hypothetical protein
MPACKLCQMEIFFDDWHISPKSGKHIPLDKSTEQPHQCPVWQAQSRRYQSCNKCGAQIYFDDKAVKSKNGKWVPQSKITGGPHQCLEII